MTTGGGGAVPGAPSVDKPAAASAAVVDRAPAVRVSATVVICTYTTARCSQLLEAVASVERQVVRPDQVVVVVDHNPELLHWARRAMPDVLVVANCHRRGLSGARNTATDVATGDVVAFLDDDAVAEPSWLRTVLTHFHDTYVVGVGTWVTPRWERGRPSWFPPEFDWVVGCSYTGQPTTVTHVRNPIGAAMALRRDTLRASGGFNSDLGRIGTHPVGCEETELAIRVVRDYPWTRIMLDPTVTVQHLVPAGRATAGYFTRRCFAEGLSKARMRRMSGGLRSTLATERRYVLRVLPHAVVRGLDDVVRGDVSGLARAAAVVAGLLTTMAGYVRGRAATVTPR